MNRARLLAALLALVSALVLARVAFGTGAPPPAVLALPAPAAPSAPAAAAPPAATPPAATPPAPPSGAAPAGPTLADLRAALARLDAARSAAYADPATADPDTWATRGCACHAADAATLRALARDGLALRRPAVTIVALRLVRPPTAARAELLLTDRLAAYAAVDASGAVVRRWPASPPRRWRVTLVVAGDRWLFGAVARAP